MILIGGLMFINLNGKKIDIILADTFLLRMKGLIGISPITYGMLFPKCNAIHTFFMKEAIDVVALNEWGEVIYIYQNLTKNQILQLKEPIKKTSILELPQYTSRSISLGMKLFFEDKNVI